jgi:hypothetical protein
VFNAGQEPGPRPTRILIDFDAGEATWLGASAQPALAERGHRGRRRSAEQRRHLAEECPRLVDHRDLHAGLGDPHRPVDDDDSWLWCCPSTKISSPSEYVT